jgi:hypothetical protein
MSGMKCHLFFKIPQPIINGKAGENYELILFIICNNKCTYICYNIKLYYKCYFNELIIDKENTIRYLDEKIQNTFRYLATRKIKQIIETNTHNTLYKRHQYNQNK